MHFSGGVVHSDSARLFLLLFLRIVGRQIRRDAFPRLPVIDGTEKKLRADIDSARGGNVNRSVPVVAQLTFLVLRQRLNAARLVCLAINSSDITALRFRVDVISIRRVGK